MNPIFVYTIKEIENKQLEVDEDLPSTWFVHALKDTDYEGIGGSVKATLALSGRDVVLQGIVQAKLRMPCARCLNPAEYDLKCQLSLLLQPETGDKEPIASRSHPSAPSAHGKRSSEKRRPAVGEGWSENKHKSERRTGKRKSDLSYLDDDDGWLISAQQADIDSYSGNQVILDGFLREAILLEVPIFPLCSETCPGIGAQVSDASEHSDGAETNIDPRLFPLLEIKKKTRP